MINEKIKPGLSAEICHKVGHGDLASVVGSGLVNVFSTAMMIAGLEEAAVAAIQPFLESGQTTVGAHLNVRHQAPSPEGMKVCFKAVLREISGGGRLLTFDVEARDEKEIIGIGSHKRVIVDKNEFEKKALSKRPV